VLLSYATAPRALVRRVVEGRRGSRAGWSTNIGIHFFDMLSWLFGGVESHAVHLRQPRRMAGAINLERARVRWFLSVESKDLPVAPVPGAKSTFRSITVDGEEIEFSEGFGDLHTVVYREMMAGRGYGIDDVRGSIELAHHIRTDEVVSPGDAGHRLLR
jgi:UDP-N-acetyl-2-amino-2-deoxyglucuronate dehydrogenase